MSKYILAIDQGTTSCRTIIFNHQSQVVAVSNKEFSQIYPKPGWVSHNAEEIWNCQLQTITSALQSKEIPPEEIAAIGITNQRETVVLWEKNTGNPIHDAIVWQCRRTAEICDQLKEKGLEELFASRTGLPIDAYFSGTKVKWILDKVPGARDKAKRGDILFGTIDSWLIYKLTKGKLHITDYTNACRTMFYNIYEKKWDSELLAALDIPEEILPEVRPSSAVYGHCDASLLGAKIPIAGIAGDQQSALFGQACFSKGMAKNTYGTGCFLLMHTGSEAIPSKSGLITSIACSFEDKIEYVLEGSIFVAGAAIQWLRDELKIIHAAEDSEYFAQKVADTGGVYLVPAFVGLGAPHWDMRARGIITGLTRGTNRNHIIRAALESMGYQTLDVIRAMKSDSGMELKELRIDGGASLNNFLCQFLADIIGLTVKRPKLHETTAQGAAYLAGLAVNYWQSQEEIQKIWSVGQTYHPQMEEQQRQSYYQGWCQAVAKAKE